MTLIGAVLDSNFDFSCDDGSGKGRHGWVRVSMFSLVERKARRASLLDAVAGSQRARYATSQVLEECVRRVVGGGEKEDGAVNIHQLLLAVEALCQVEVGRLEGGHVCAGVRDV